MFDIEGYSKNCKMNLILTHSSPI